MISDFIKKLEVLSAPGKSAELILFLQDLYKNVTPETSKDLITAVQKFIGSKDIGVRFWAKKILQKADGPSRKTIEDVPKKQSILENPLLLELPIELLLLKLQEEKLINLPMPIITKVCSSKDKKAFGFLVNYLQTCRDPITISFLTKQIGINFPNEETLVVLIPFLRHEDDRVVANTLEGLSFINTPKSLVLFSQMLKHQSNRVKTEAAKGINKQDPEIAFVVISKMLDSKQASHFQISACHAAGLLQNANFIPCLEHLLFNELTFSHALEAIEKIGGKQAIEVLSSNYQKFSDFQKNIVDKVAVKINQKLVDQKNKPISLSDKVKKSVFDMVNQKVTSIGQSIEKHFNKKDDVDQSSGENEPEENDCNAPNGCESPSFPNGSNEQVTAKKETKNCQFCGETIDAKAKKCRFCKEFLIASSRTSSLRYFGIFGSILILVSTVLPFAKLGIFTRTLAKQDESMALVACVFALIFTLCFLGQRYMLIVLGDILFCVIIFFYCQSVLKSLNGAGTEFDKVIESMITIDVGAYALGAGILITFIAALMANTKELETNIPSFGYRKKVTTFLGVLIGNRHTKKVAAVFSVLIGVLCGFIGGSIIGEHFDGYHIIFMLAMAVIGYSVSSGAFKAFEIVFNEK